MARTRARRRAREEAELNAEDSYEGEEEEEESDRLTRRPPGVCYYVCIPLTAFAAVMRSKTVLPGLGAPLSGAGVTSCTAIPRSVRRAKKARSGVRRRQVCAIRTVPPCAARR